MPRRNDNEVGSARADCEGPRQTSEQAAIVEQGGDGITDAERADMTSGGPEAGRMTPAIGGSSGGHSDQIAAQGPDEDRKVAGGLYETERSQSRHEKEQP